MTPEQQRIAIAQACGITAYLHDLPDYLNDLNAMYEAEQALWAKDWRARDVFVDHLARIINPVHGYRMKDAVDLLDATAAQRAEAFLRTLNLWKGRRNNDN